jgi:hypothetical protein
MSKKLAVQVLCKSLTDFIDAGLSHCQTDTNKLFLLTALALHIEKRQQDISGAESPPENLIQQESQLDKRDNKRLKKAMQKL